MISLKGFNQQIITLKKSGTPTTGAPAVISANNTAAAAGANGVFVGVINTVSDTTVGVQMTGYVEMAYSGTAPSCGMAILVADGSGGVKAAETGRTVTVVSVDTTYGKVGFIL